MLLPSLLPKPHKTLAFLISIIGATIYQLVTQVSLFISLLLITISNPALRFLVAAFKIYQLHLTHNPTTTTPLPPSTSHYHLFPNSLLTSLLFSVTETNNCLPTIYIISRTYFFQHLGGNVPCFKIFFKKVHFPASIEELPL